MNGSDLRDDLAAIAELIQPGERVLDLGCGDGALLRYLVDTRQVVGRGIELSEAGVLASMRRGLSVRQGNLHEGLGDYPDGSFNTVILSQTIPYLNDLTFIFKEMMRVGRRAIVSFPNWGYWRCRLELLLTGRAPVAEDLPQPWYTAPRARLLTIQDFEEFCEQQGIQIASQVFLKGDQKIATSRDRNWRATTAIYELKP
ncbi:MAG: methionine biosynthesis protein MetW [Anaerolineales bacterium]|jgi:methionine biosynthesis protein MetW|nr:methionine biosynthesis protein MetW [Anaerolineales bacterium]